MSRVRVDSGGMTSVAAEPSELNLSPSAVWDRENFRALVDAHSNRLFALAYRMTGNAHDAEDLVQESFLRAYRSRSRFDGRASVTTWLQRICVNASLDHLRRRRVRPVAAAEPDAGPSLAERLPSPDASPERLLLSQETGARVRAAMAMLSDKERTAFILRHYEGLSLEEIGAVLGLRTAATKNTIFRGVRKLRTALEHL